MALYNGIFCLSIFVLCVSIIIVFLLPNVLYYHMHSLGDTINCPWCYGQSMCKCFNNNFSFNWNYFWTNIINLIFGKGVIFGFCDNSLVVIKKFSIPKKYVGMSTNKGEDFQSISEFAKLTKSTFEDLEIPQNFKICPSLEKAENLYMQFIEYTNKSFDEAENSTLHKNLLHMIKVNIAPIIQKIGWVNQWAVSEYLGSCGDAVFSKYCGEALTDVFPRLNWIERSLIAKQLLEFAFNATFKHPDFAFYFTDMTPDNFAVSSDNIARLVDVEHVIVVDRRPTAQPITWNEYHKSYHDPSEQGFAFSTKEICSHKTSDLNVYSICQGILSNSADLLKGGLLHSPPKPQERVTKLIQECVLSASGQSRFDTAQAIIQELNSHGP